VFYMVKLPDGQYVGRYSLTDELQPVPFVNGGTFASHEDAATVARAYGNGATVTEEN
jgi:hypothetical protein